MKLSQLVRLSAVCTTAIIGATGISHAATGPTGSDRTFAVKAAQGGMTEVKLAAIALQKSKDAKVLAFARKMNTDHTKNNAQLSMIVKGEGMIPPSDVGAANKASMGKLQRLGGAAFNSAYLKSQVTAHEQMLALMKQEATYGHDPKLVAFAKATVPVVQQHLTMAQSDVSGSGSSM